MIEFDKLWKYEEPENDLVERITLTFPDVLPYNIFPKDLEKRCSGMLDLLANTKSNKKYNINQAIALHNKFLGQGRPDLAQVIKIALARR
jgi:hypothetical protein